MASTYVNDLRLNEMATGDASGSWGTVTNTNLELIGEAFSYGTETIGDADSTLTIADGAADAARSFYLKITSSVDLTTTRIVTLGPNTVSKVWMIENATTGSQVITIKQGSGATINVPNGQVKMLATDGAGSGGAVLDLLVDVDLTGTTTLVNLDVSGAVDIAGDLTLSAGGDGALRFTAASSVKVLDNNAAALVFEEADNAYMTFVTTDGSEAVKFDKALDINAATQIDATVTVGVDDTGYDVKFFGATTGKSLLWDESADSLIVTGSTSLQGGLEVGVDDTGYDVKFFGATTGKSLLWDESADSLIVTGSTSLQGGLEVGVDDTGYDVKFFGATTGKSLLWDESADSLIVTGTTTLVGTTNLDAVDIDGATQIDATVTVGVDDTGYDVKFFGATAGAYMLWDESADDLILGGAAGLSVNSTALVTGVLTTTAATVFNGGFASNADSTLGGSLTVNGPRVLVQRANDDSSIAFANNASGSPSSHVWATGLDYSNSNSFSIAYGSGGIPSLDEAKLVIDVSGNVGIGTSSPVAKLQVDSSSATYSANIRVRNSNFGNGVVGAASGILTVATDMSNIAFYTGSNYGVDGTSVPTNERMRINSSGNVRINNTDAENYRLKIAFAGDSEEAIGLQSTISGSGNMLRFINSAGTTVGLVSTNNTATTYATSSDYRLKTDAQPMVGASDRVLALNPVNFEWISSGERVDGFLAHEAQEIVPEAVHGTKDAMRDEEYEVTAAVEATYDEDGNELTAAVPAVMGTRSVPDMQGIDQSKLVPLLTAALQEALTKIADMEIRLSALEG
jgi:DUF2075 family protein